MQEDFDIVELPQEREFRGQTVQNIHLRQNYFTKSNYLQPPKKKKVNDYLKGSGTFTGIDFGIDGLSPREEKEQRLDIKLDIPEYDFDREISSDSDDEINRARFNLTSGQSQRSQKIEPRKLGDSYKARPISASRTYSRANGSKLRGASEIAAKMLEPVQEKQLTWVQKQSLAYRNSIKYNGDRHPADYINEDIESEAHHPHAYLQQEIRKPTITRKPKPLLGNCMVRGVGLDDGCEKNATIQCKVKMFDNMFGCGREICDDHWNLVEVQVGQKRQRIKLCYACCSAERERQQSRKRYLVGFAIGAPLSIIVGIIILLFVTANGNSPDGKPAAQLCPIRFDTTCDAAKRAKAKEGANVYKKEETKTGTKVGKQTVSIQPPIN